MSIEGNKLMNLADGKVLYDDLRQRMESADSQLNGAIDAKQDSLNLSIVNGCICISYEEVSA